MKKYSAIKNKSKYLDDHLSIDINFLNRHGALIPGTDFSLSWGEVDNVISSMAVVAREGSLEIFYCQKLEDGYGHPCEDHIQLSHTSCHYGYQRPWFVCPDCHSRAAKLYHLEAGLVCRKCSHLAYQSQSESRFDRAIRKIIKIRQRLGADGNLFMPVLVLPADMHCKTFYRLSKQLEAADKYLAESISLKIPSISSK